MDMHSRTAAGLQVITVDAARIDAAVAIRFKDAIRAETDDDATRIVLDLQNVCFVDSSGLGAIVAAKKQLGDQRPLELANLMPDVKKVFHLTRMDTVFTIHSELSEAYDLRDTG